MTAEDLSPFETGIICCNPGAPCDRHAEPKTKAEEFENLRKAYDDTLAVNVPIHRSARAAARLYAFVLHNHALFARALRMHDASENPSRELLEVLSKAFARTKARYEHGQDMLDEERALLAAFRDAVK